MRNNWITIFDNTPEARIVYTSESITDHTGWEPEELIGKEAYELFHPGDHKSLRKVHTANVYNEKMSCMVVYRFLHRDGHYITIETIIHCCHDVIVGSNYLYDESALDHKMRANSVDEIFICLANGTLQLAGAWNDRQERMQKTLSMEKVWVDHHIILKQERRFCLILNRFTEALNVVYASSLATELVALNIPLAIGTSFYQYVPERDFQSMQAQIDMAKEHDMVIRVRFDWVIDREKGLSEPVEAIVNSTDDGLVMVLRLSPRLFLDEQ
ncbi:PAS domain-containing protein [Blakeslea trispora]|nr:PAS domain-containing protein [Blakeslea trispora]